MSKHTPGPWEYCCNGMLEPPTVALKQNPKMQIAEITSSDADARLIAAAPEMKQELTDIAQMCTNAIEFADELNPEEILKRVNSIIAKAEGKE